MASDEKRTPKTRLWVCGLLLTSGGVFAYTSVLGGTSEFSSFSIFWFLVVGLPTILLSTLVAMLGFLVIGRIVERKRAGHRVKCYALLAPWIVTAKFWLFLAFNGAKASSRFKAEVLNPAPASVHDIRVVGFNSFLARRWLLSFRIDSSDIGGIVARKSLTRTNYFDMQQIIAQDVFLKRVEWARDLKFDSNAVFYTRTVPGVPSVWVRLVVNTNSSQAFFFSGHQN